MTSALTSARDSAETMKRPSRLQAGDIAGRRAALARNMTARDHARVIHRRDGRLPMVREGQDREQAR
ncbi:hypothetical protein BV87_03605 [Sphingobium yanoikuyae]|uniref:Uncharacterized protein n=1 Tax=Sphingobium yanoikuyae TaxID=13690 RepID=A0A2D1QY93_SPHYA|nr:hypothetical protein BV87_03605 [Sphingobium yanoikuyae]